MGYNIRDHLGQRVRVRHCIGAYRLPDGLPEGAEVVLEDFQPGYWTVNYNGGRFRVAMPCVGDGGRLSRASSRTRPGCRPRVRCEIPNSNLQAPEKSQISNSKLF
jgi:hypothetical protein